VCVCVREKIGCVIGKRILIESPHIIYSVG